MKEGVWSLRLSMLERIERMRERERDNRKHAVNTHCLANFMHIITYVSSLINKDNEDEDKERRPFSLTTATF